MICSVITSFRYVQRQIAARDGFQFVLEEVTVIFWFTLFCYLNCRQYVYEIKRENLNLQ